VSAGRGLARVGYGLPNNTRGLPVRITTSMSPPRAQQEHENKHDHMIYYVNHQLCGCQTCQPLPFISPVRPSAPVLSLLRTASHLPSLVSRRGLVYGPILIGRLSNTLEETPFESSSERPQRLFKSFAKRARDALQTSFGTGNRSGGKETSTTFHPRIFPVCPRVHHGLGLI
jgi:hypothetical protein